MNKTISVLALLTLALALPITARAQTYGTISLTGVPATMATASGISNISSGNVIDCRGNRLLGLSISAGAITTNSTYQIFFVRSQDNVTYESTNTAPHVFTLTCSSITPSTLSTNIDMGAFGYLKAYSAYAGTNGNSNVAVTVSLKPGN